MADFKDGRPPSLLTAKIIMSTSLKRVKHWTLCIDLYIAKMDNIVAPKFVNSSDFVLAGVCPRMLMKTLMVPLLVEDSIALVHTGRRRSVSLDISILDSGRQFN